MNSSVARWVLWLSLGVLTFAAAGCAPDKLEMQVDSIDHDDLGSAPVPSNWVIEGKPEARVKLLAKAPDDGLDAALWDCTAGKFHWHFGSDEFVHILQGEVTVSHADGSGPRVLKPGSVAYFPAGMHSIWHVQKYVKKLALVRDNEVGLLFKVRRKLGELFGSK